MKLNDDGDDDWRAKKQKMNQSETITEIFQQNLASSKEDTIVDDVVDDDDGDDDAKTKKMNNQSKKY